MSSHRSYRLVALKAAALVLSVTSFATGQAATEKLSGQPLATYLPEGTPIDFVWIAPGVFYMGSATADTTALGNEFPRHQVKITKGFFLGRYELTQAQWVRTMGTRPWQGRDWVVEDPQYPAAYISWEVAQGFIRQLNRAAGDSLYRLPTEAEWEYACRAGTSTTFSFGDAAERAGDYAWYIDNTRADPYARKGGLKLPNPWGLHDMNGNMREWCADWYGPYPETTQIDPRGPASGTFRAVRGGGFFFYKGISSLRAAFRGAYLPHIGYAAMGLRLVRIR